MKKVSPPILGALLILLITGTVHSMGQDKVKMLTGQEVLASIISPGEITCVAGEFTGNLYAPCTAGTTRVHIKNQVVELIVVNVTPSAEAGLLAGSNTLEADCNLDAALKGSCWGKFHWAVAEGETWEGVIQTNHDFAQFSWDIEMVGRGHGGGLEGLKLNYTSHTPGQGDPMTGDFVVVIHNPKAGKD